MNGGARSRLLGEARLPLLGWRMVEPLRDESVRWEHDGLWIAITLVDDGRALIDGSAGQRQILPSFADAVALAQRWRRARRR